MSLTFDLFHIALSSTIDCRIKDDDRLIQAEGIETLTEAELREECRERGMLGLVSVDEMRQLVMPFLLYLFLNKLAFMLIQKFVCYIIFWYNFFGIVNNIKNIQINFAC